MSYIDNRNIPKQVIKTVDLLGTSGQITLVKDVRPQTRASLTLTNTSSTQIIYLGFGIDAVVGLNPLYASQTYNEVLDPAFIPLPFEIRAIASADGATVSIQERLETR